MGGWARAAESVYGRFQNTVSDKQWLSASEDKVMSALTTT